MQHFVSASVLATLLLALAPPVEGQETTTEAQFLEALDQGHVAVRALEEDVARAEAARRRASTLPDPRLELGLEHPESSPRQSTWTLAWTPPLDGRRGLTRDAAEAGLEAARQRLVFDTIRLRRAAREVYADWALAVERREVLRGQVALVAALAGQHRRQAEAGEASGVAAARIELELAELRSGLSQAEAFAARAEARARAWRPDLSAGSRPVRPALPALPETQRSVERSDVQAVRAEIRQAELEARLGKRFVASPEIQAGWQRLDDRGQALDGPVFGLAWTLPVFDRGQVARHEAARRLEIAEARLALLGSQVRAEREGARAAYDTLMTAAEDARAATEHTDRIVEGATASFRAGESSLTDLLDTLRAVQGAHQQRLASHAAALEAHRDLEVALGHPLVGDNP